MISSDVTNKDLLSGLLLVFNEYESVPELSFLRIWPEIRVIHALGVLWYGK